MNKEKGITIVSLVITIIVLLILATVSITTLFGNNGIITRSNQATYQRGMEEAKEEINLSILDLRLNHQGIPTLEEVKEKLLNDGTIIEAVILDETTLEVTSRKEYILEIAWNSNGICEVIEVGKEEAKEPRPEVIVSLKEPIEDYRATIVIHGRDNKNGIAKLYCPDGSIVEYSGDKEFLKEYEVMQNGTYRFKIESTKGRVNSKVITVNNITKALPGEGNIHFSSITWENNSGEMELSTESGLTIQYQINETIEKNWKEGTIVNNLKHGDVIYARLYDGIKAGDVVTQNVIDSIKPTITFGTNGNTTWQKSQSTTVMVSDKESDVGEGLKYVWTTSTSQPADSSFTNTFTSGEKITKSDGTGNNWYLWVMAIDIAENVQYARSNAFYLDNTGPVINSVTNRGTYNSITVTVTNATDDNVGEVVGYQYKKSTDPNWSEETTQKEYIFTGLERQTEYTLQIKAKDLLGNWGESKNIIVTPDASLAHNVEIGDYVGYHEGSGNTYTSLGSANGSADQTFRTDNSLKWQVLDINGDTVTLVSQTVVKTKEGNIYSLQGKEGYWNMVGELNAIGSIYGKGLYATSGRHINEDDVSKVAGVTEEMKKQFDSNYNTSKTTYTNGTFLNKDGGENIATPSNPITVTSMWYVYYGYDAPNTKDINSAKYKMIFAPSESYWLATLNHNCEVQFVSYGALGICTNGLFIGTDFFQSHGPIGNRANYVRPVVVLETGIKTTGGNGTENSPWMLTK